MPADRLDRLCSDINGTLERINRQLRHVVWLMLFNLTLSLIIFTKVFFP